MSKTGRGWGPFSGAQLTTMVCVIVAAVAFPVAASAVTGSNVFVTDATSGKTAKVSTAGAVSVSGVVTSKLQGSASGNKVEATKDQQLLTTEASPSSYYTAAAASVSSPTLIATPPAGDALILKSLQVSTFESTSTDPYVQFFLQATGSGCALVGRTALQFLDVPSGANAVSVLPFDPGLVVPAGHELCAVGVSTDAYTYASVYLVPAAAVAGSVHTSVGRKAAP